MFYQMRYDPQKHHRRSIRLKGYDYSQPGLYFVTVVTQDHKMLFGDVVNGKMVLNKFGEIVRNEWLKTAEIRKNIELDEYVIMPNHIHGIIVIVNNDGDMVRRGTMHRRGTMRRAPTTTVHQNIEQFGKPTSNTIPTIIRGFKSTVTKQINKIRNMPGIAVWQRNYWEHIVRNEIELNRIRKYIIENPKKWNDDRNYGQ